MTETSRRGGTGHRLLSAALVIVASLAVVATSDPYTEVSETHSGVPFDLSPENPEVTLPFVFEISDEARDNVSVQARFDFTPTWRNVATATPELQITLVDSLGAVVPTPYAGESARVSCNTQCLGSGEVVVRWPPDLVDGEVTVEWSAAGVVGFDEQPPDGAEVSFAVVDPSTPSPSRILGEGRFRVQGQHNDPRIVYREHIDIVADRPTGEYWLEVPDFWAGYGAVAFVVTPQGRTAVSQGSSVAIPPPHDCSTPCAWSAELVVVDESFRSDPVTWVTWRLRHQGDPHDISVESGREKAPTVTTHLTGGPITLTGDESVSITVRLEVDAATVDVPDFDLSAPQVILSMRGLVDPRTAPFPDIARIEQRIGGLVVPHFEGIRGTSRSIKSYDTPADIWPATTPARLECDTGGCVLDFEVGFEATGLGDVTVPLDWELTAELAYPFAEEPPAGARMVLTQR